MVIYKTTNLVNGKFYIGQDSKNNPNYLGSGYILLKSIKKYGRENFRKELLELCKNKNQLDTRERYWIKELKSTDPVIGYNIVDGGQGGNLGEYANNKKKESLKNFFKENPDARTGSKNSNYNNILYHFYNIETHEELKCTKFSLAEHIGINKSSAVNSLCVGRRLIYKNWILFINKGLVTKEYLKKKRQLNSNYSYCKTNAFKEKISRANTGRIRWQSIEDSSIIKFSKEQPIGYIRYVSDNKSNILVLCPHCNRNIKKRYIHKHARKQLKNETKKL